MFEAMRHRAAGGHLDLLAEFYEFKFLIALKKSISQYISQVNFHHICSHKELYEIKPVFCPAHIIFFSRSLWKDIEVFYDGK